MLRDVIGHELVKSQLKKVASNPPKVIIFSGPSGVGKKFTALNFIDEMYNGYLSKKIFTHPDIFIFDPQGKTFKLELIHKMKSYMSTSPFELKNKFFILNNVELMNKESANSCLKIFEEVPDYVQIILLTDSFEEVLDTLKSRATLFNFNPIKNLKEYYPTLSNLQLKIISGCPGRISEIENEPMEELYTDILNFFKSFSKLNYFEIIDWCVRKEKYKPELINQLMFIAIDDLYLEKDKSIPFNFIIDTLKNLKEKNKYSLNNSIHFRSSFIEAKYNLSITN